MKKYIISTDGACRGNGKPDNYGSWGMLVFDENNEVIFSDSLAKAPTTNNQMELTAALKGLEYILNTNDKDIEYTVKVDSTYVFNSINLGWVYNWKKRNFIVKGSEYRPNWEIWNEVLQVIDKINTGGLKMSWDKVEGHEDYYNILVDALCNTTMDEFKANEKKSSEPTKKITLDRIDSEDFFNVDTDFCYDAVKTDYKEDSGIQMVEESELTEDQKNAIMKVIDWYKNHRNENQVFTVGGAAGCGKCLSVDSLVVTNDGYKRIGDVEVNDMIYSMDGKLCEVTGVFPQEEKKVCYKVLFNDGTEIICDAEQLFSYYFEKEDELVTTLFSEILSKYCTNEDNTYVPNKKINFPITKPLRFQGNSVSIDPLFAGVLLGIGCSDYYFNDSDFVMHLSKIVINNDNIVEQISNVMVRYNYILSTRNFNRGVLSYVFNSQKAGVVNEFKNKMISNGLAEGDRIPNEYLIAPFRIKTKFLEGFLASKINTVNDFDVNILNTEMLNDFKFMVQSLGGIVLPDENTKNSVYRQCTICLPSVFTDKPSNLLNRHIKTIEKLENKLDTICIKVNHPTELFLSNDCLVVHNTSIIPHIINSLNLTMSTGKALPYNAKVLKKNGFVPIGSCKIGDEICGGNGEFCEITGVFPQGKRHMYKVKFSDGTSVICDGEHLWTVAAPNEKFVIKTLNQIREEGLRTTKGRIKFRVPIVQPVQFPERKLPIDPYLLGVLLNGTFDIGDAITIRTKHQETLPKVKQILARMNFKLGPAKQEDVDGIAEYYVLSKVDTIKDNVLNEKLHELGLKGLNNEQKFIPPIYLHASINQRRELLNALINTSGFFSHKTTLKTDNKSSFAVEFMSKSLQYLKDIRFLVQSLGGLAELHEISDIETTESFKGWHRLSVKVRSFKMDIQNKEFTDNCNLNRVILVKNIIEVEDLNEEQEAVCIKVDDPFGLFITNDFTVTHNTNVDINIGYCTFTGKASMVLQRKGIPSKTIHNLIYNTTFDKKQKRFIFSKKPLRELRHLKLIIVDEFSMVSAEIMKDLMSYNIPILMFGDPYQLPPIGTANPFMNSLDVCLTKIHRQAEDNPILVLATKIRNGESIQYGDWGKAKVLPKNMITKEIMFNANQVLCAKNNTRHEINDNFRRNLGFADLQPKLGEKIICLSNNWGMEIMGFFLVNGMIGNISDIGFDLEGRPILDFQPEFLSQSFLKVQYDENIFFRKEKDKKNWRYFQELNEFDFGYCITVHKAQGSQWEKVVVWEEVLRPELHRNWLYTAVTRPEEELIVFH